MTATGNVLLEVKDLSLSFGGLKAVDSLSFEIYAGETFGLIGPNGAGKPLFLTVSLAFTRLMQAKFCYTLALKARN